MSRSLQPKVVLLPLCRYDVYDTVRPHTKISRWSFVVVVLETGFACRHCHTHVAFSDSG